MCQLQHLRRLLAGFVLAMYCTLAVGSHGLHGWLGCVGGNCPPQIAGCPCGLPHSDEPIADDEEFSNDPTVERRHDPGHGDDCGEPGFCSICQYHAQGQLTGDAPVALDDHVPLRLLPRVSSIVLFAPFSLAHPARGPPECHLGT